MFASTALCSSAVGPLSFQRIAISGDRVSGVGRRPRRCSFARARRRDSRQRFSLEASKFALGVAGIKPAPHTNMNVNIELKAGYVLDLRWRRPVAIQW
jgi:hypothetical protein